MSKFLAFINKERDLAPVGAFQSAQDTLQDSMPPGIGVETFSHNNIQVAYWGKVSIHLDEPLGLLLMLSGYFRHAGSASEYSDRAKDFLPFFNGNDDPSKGNFEGCFSLAVFDLNSMGVWLLTDRFGTRPLHYNFGQRYVAVSSEAYLLLPWLDDLSIPTKSLTDSFWLGFARAPESMMSGIAKVEDNTLVNITGEGDIAKYALQHPLIIEPDCSLGFEDVVSQIEEALENEFATLGKTNKRVAVLLSGGVDSSIMAAYAAKHFTECVAFSCEIEGFNNPELERAEYVAEKLGLRHEIVRLKLDDLCGVFSEVVSMLEGPSRHINNLVVRRIFQEIKGYDAIIGGDGADALFGTKTNRTIVNIEKKVAVANRVPDLLKPLISMVVGRVSPGKRHHLNRILANDIESLLHNLFTIDYEERVVSVAGKLGVSRFSGIPLRSYKSCDIVGKSLEANLALFLRCMLERNTRLASDSGTPIYYPFLTEGMLTISRKLPYTHRFDQDGNAKPALRELCSRRIDSAVIEWPKIGFETPERAWLTDELKPYLDRVLTNNGGITKVLGLELGSDDVAAIESSNRMMWWLMTLDASLLDMETQFSTLKKE